MLDNIIKNKVTDIFNNLYKAKIEPSTLQVSSTKKGFKGDYSVVLFPLLKIAKKSPQLLAEEIAAKLMNWEMIEEYEAVGGYLNISISNNYWLNFLKDNYSVNAEFRMKNTEKQNVVIEFSSPNTNKPQHLGHIRNNLLGDSLARLLRASGHEVKKVNLVNDRGIHICKSMLAWEKWGEGKTPESENKKGDHFVGNYYVLFNQKYQEEINRITSEKNITKEQAEKESELLRQAKKMLKKWERNNKKVRELWKTMNDWVFEGFDKTYSDLGIEFDKTYLESETYLEGKAIVLTNMKKGRVEVADDDSVFIDLEAEGLDKKILLRSDGTSVYMTQDIGTAVIRYDDYKFDKHIYVVGNEQDYHFKVLKIVLDKFGYQWSKNLEHFSYGMVELPDGKMKSREGKVVDADDLIAEMIATAKLKTEELGKLDGLSEAEKDQIVQTVALAALKYFILKVDPRKNMTFNPQESIDFNGNTGPFIQYTYARINSVLTKAKDAKIEFESKQLADIQLQDIEKQLIKHAYNYPLIVKDAAENYSPALIANYVYELSKDYNRFYHDYSILKTEDENTKILRLQISKIVAYVIKSSLNLLGIDVPQKM